jgi:HlyD family type I secretion membrane fusion protein
LERDAAALDAQLAEARAQQAQARGTIAEIRLKLSQAGASQIADADAGLVESGRTIADLRQRIAACDAALRRSIIRAPVSGTVMNLDPAAPGAVIMAGERLMDIVPSRDALVVEARIAPRDIDAVRPGLHADVHFLSFDGRLAGAWPGHVEQVSADSMTDARTGAAYYAARVVLGPPPAAMKTVALHPGMPADVSIVTGTRTPLDYLLRPLKTSMRHAMRED